MLSAVAHAAAEFVNRESNGRSLITVTEVRYTNREKSVEILVSVMPREAAHAVIDFLKRQEKPFSAYLRTQIKARGLPHTTFLLDPGMGSARLSDLQ